MEPKQRPAGLSQFRLQIRPLISERGLFKKTIKGKRFLGMGNAEVAPAARMQSASGGGGEGNRDG